MKKSVTVEGVVFTGKVVKGKGLGTKYFVPTLNLDLSEEVSLYEGVYSCKVKRGSEELGLGAMHFGRRLTVDGEFSCEIFLINFEGQQLNGEIVEVEVLKFVRGVRKFANYDELKKQIEKDIEKIVEFW